MNIPTEAVKAVIENKLREILFLQRNPSTRDTNNWDLPGGLVEDGELLEIALRREITEELGLEDIEVGERVGEWSFFRPLDGKTVHVTNLKCRLLGGTLIRLKEDEHIAFTWVKRDGATSLRVKDPSLFDALG
ncbi:MAG TPA: NUDIX hydrolase [Candidatus Saccharimonadia bacterium]|nr:NUDIX hydrolase [Candidatus Saccharimonadia bacterium]